MHKPTSFLDAPHELLKFHGYDDEIEFNTQISSQWDSLCKLQSIELTPILHSTGHYLHQGSCQGYNGAKPTLQDLSQNRSTSATASLPTLERMW